MRTDIHDRVPVPSIGDTVERWINVLGFKPEDVSPAYRQIIEQVVDALREREQTIAEYLIGAAAVRGGDLAADAVAMMRAAGMEVPS